MNPELQPALHNFSEYPLSDVINWQIQRQVNDSNRLDYDLASLRLACSDFRTFPLDHLAQLPIGITLLAQPSSALGREMAKNPLRCVVQRAIEQYRTGYSSTITVYHEVLQCGHPYSFTPILPESYTSKRRRCAACGSASASRHIAVRRLAGKVSSVPRIAGGVSCLSSSPHNGTSQQDASPALPPKKQPAKVSAHKLLAKKAGA